MEKVNSSAFRYVGVWAMLLRKSSIAVRRGPFFAGETLGQGAGGS